MQDLAITGLSLRPPSNPPSTLVLHVQRGAKENANFPSTRRFSSNMRVCCMQNTLDWTKPKPCYLFYCASISGYTILVIFIAQNNNTIACLVPGRTEPRRSGNTFPTEESIIFYCRPAAQGGRDAMTRLGRPVTGGQLRSVVVQYGTGLGFLTTLLLYGLMARFMSDNVLRRWHSA